MVGRCRSSRLGLESRHQWPADHSDNLWQSSVPVRKLPNSCQKTNAGGIRPRRRIGTVSAGRPFAGWTVTGIQLMCQASTGQFMPCLSRANGVRGAILHRASSAVPRSRAACMIVTQNLWATGGRPSAIRFRLRGGPPLRKSERLSPTSVADATISVWGARRLVRRWEAR